VSCLGDVSGRSLHDGYPAKNKQHDCEQHATAAEAKRALVRGG